VLSRKLGQDAEVPDLLHEVFIAAFQSIGRLREPHALPVFLRQIAVHVAHGHIRRRVQRRALVCELALTVAVGNGPAAQPMGEARASIESVLSRLPEGERVPFRLRFLCELALSEVAAETGLSVPTVKRRLLAARRRIAGLDATV
jgi:RNA polymerase sigma-70 factor (ECF subfamily)